MTHEVLPECIDRLARIEKDISFVKDNHLTHIEAEIVELRESIRSTQKLIVSQLIGVGIAMLGLLAKALIG